ncbi:NAD(P)-binding domain-containing protein [Dactylosporangium sp. NPDC005572]|uniref:NAD(P)-dependent oxidoreductase n=1 Tax=Dactylosporangium sp. NPDC005572 TaxID=3156889 RepID=UPI0033A81481
MSSKHHSPDAVTDGLRAGVIGLGMIGGSVARALVARNRPLAVYDVRQDASASLPGVPAQLSSPAKVAGVSDVVFVAVVDANQARSALQGPDGILSAAPAGMVVVLMSTVSLEAVRELAALCATADVTLLDCGVTTTTIDPTRKIVAMLGGDETTVARVLPVLDDAAAGVVYCGPLGAGMATKIARNVITYGSWRVVDEASRLLEAYGASPRNLIEVISTSDPTGRTLLTPLGLRDGEEAMTPERIAYIMGLLHKDLAAARDLATEVGVALPLTELTDATAEQIFDFAKTSR